MPNPAVERSQFDSAGHSADWVHVVPTANDGVWVEVSLLFHNGHTCQLQGDGEWKSNHVLIQKYDAEACDLKIHFRAGKAVLSDDGRCRAMSCGARGAYDGIALPKRGSL